MLEIANCPVCRRDTATPHGKTPMACPHCRSNLRRAARFYVNEEGVLVRYDGRLADIVMNEAIRKVGENVFYCHTELERITFGSALAEIGSSAFGKCASLTEIVLPPNLCTLGANSFSHCSGLSAVMLPARLTELPNGAFEACSHLKSIDLSFVEKIGNNALAHCLCLADVTLGRVLTEIGSYTFFECPSLSRIVIPKSVRKIEMSAFGGIGSAPLSVLCEAASRPEGWSSAFCQSGGKGQLPLRVCEVTWGFRG